MKRCTINFDARQKQTYSLTPESKKTFFCPDYLTTTEKIQAIKIARKKLSQKEIKAISSIIIKIESLE